MLPFLRDQKLFALKPDAAPREALHPERFHAARHEDGRGGDGPAAPDSACWEELPRDDLLAASSGGRPLHRVALTTDAGLGKSYNLAWLSRELNDPGRGTVAFVLPVGDFHSTTDLIADRLVPAVRAADGNHHERPERIRAGLERLRDRGRLVLLFDGLDQAGDENVAALAGLLSPSGEWAACCVVVAGRPFALERHWDALFAGRPWSFVQIGEFDAGLQRAALGRTDGRDRYDLIHEEARDILTVPRVLEYLRPLCSDELEGLRTAADVYWHACGYMLTRSLGVEETRHERRRLLALLGALAFTMYARTERHARTGELRPNLDRVLAIDIDEFLDEVLGRLLAAVPRYTEESFWRDLRTLTWLNAHLNHGWLDVSTVGGQGQPLLWRNASLQEFFAAFWATRWADAADSGRLREWVVDPLADANGGFYWFWRYASEMPDEAVLPGSRTPPASWIDAMTPLYAGPDRSTEFIYRSWDRMERFDAEPLRRFEAEFRGILGGHQGSEKQEIARRWLDGFISLVQGDMPGDTGTFVMGDDQADERNRKTLTPFRMHRFCVTNVEYELFAPRHANYRWGDERHPAIAKTGDPSADVRCPVVNVSWYDAWCLTRWLGVPQSGGTSYRLCLPTEKQWEYACRAGKTTPFTFRAPHDGTSCTTDICNFYGIDPALIGAKTPLDADVVLFREATIPVDDLAPNPWGFFQMHGNVWEMCDSWYSPGAPTRVLRGGSEIDGSRYCRSSFRIGGVPGGRNQSVGFRLAAVPASS
jgi:formylglycine-generating enzyme required for sulfatase activity